LFFIISNLLALVVIIIGFVMTQFKRTTFPDDEFLWKIFKEDWETSNPEKVNLGIYYFLKVPFFENAELNFNCVRKNFRGKV